jgi:hypothetical protein
MTKDDVLRILETDFTDPGSYKSGEYLAEHIFWHIGLLIQNERQYIIEILNDWLNLRIEPHTMLAVRTADKFDVSELVPQIKALKHEIENGNSFPRYYIQRIDKALMKLES